MKTDWPPLITDGARPRWMLWRDRVLTMLVWCLFLALFIEQCLVFHARVVAYLSIPDAEWEFLLAPFVAMVGIMVAWLFVTAVLTYRQAVRARRHSQPPPLSLEAEAAHFKITPTALAEARGKQIIAVGVEEDARLRFETPTYTAPAGDRDPPAPPSPGQSIPGR